MEVRWSLALSALAYIVVHHSMDYAVEVSRTRLIE
jgi:hypothetical protein